MSLEVTQQDIMNQPKKTGSFATFQRVLVALVFIVIAFFGGLYLGKSGYDVEVKKNPPEVKFINKYPYSDEIDFARFWEIWELVSNEHLDRPVDPDKMLWGAISGMVDSLDDPYTTFLPPTLNEAVTNQLNGTYQGIGAELAIKENQLIIVAPLDGSPAKEAGVKAGDKIMEIEGESTLGLSVTEAVAKIRGEAGTVSTLTLQRGLEEPFKVMIRRGVVTVSSVSWEDKGDGTAYIRIGRFGSETVEDWNKIASEVNVKMDELDAIVLDVRGNPGGYLDAAVYIADEFISGKETIVWQENALKDQKADKAGRVGAFERVPLVVVMIDEGSASASEILAGALKERFDAVLVGKPSFGKGTIQEAKDFADESGIHITVAKWLTPDKNWMNENNLVPDYEVEITEEDIENKYDAQLEKALEIAREI